MKILLIGNGLWPWFEEACAQALARLGVEVHRIDSASYFHERIYGKPSQAYVSTWARIQNHILWGPLLNRFNAEIIDTTTRLRPDTIFLFNSPHIYPSTLVTLRQRAPQTRIAIYTNDNPFSPHARRGLWRHFIAGIPYCDIALAYRHANLEDFQRAGAPATHLLRSYYVIEQDYRVSLTAQDTDFISDVVFVGHYEHDGRGHALNHLLAAGIDLRIHGGNWAAARQVLETSAHRHPRWPIRPAMGEDYRKAISGARIALCFLSKLNADTYTRRNFQIPAIGAFMLSEYSEDLARLFTEGVEAEYFRTPGELLDKVRYYLANPAHRERIAEAGHSRLLKSQHEVTDRMRDFLKRLASVPHSATTSR